MTERYYYVYMMQSSSRRALYTGVTGHLRKRVWQHKTGAFESFSADYKTHRLVWFEVYKLVENAIAREKQLKGWRRSKKEALVVAMNPEWKDLSEGWFDEPQGPSTRAAKAAALARDDTY